MPNVLTVELSKIFEKYCLELGVNPSPKDLRRVKLRHAEMQTLRELGVLSPPVSKEREVEAEAKVKTCRHEFDSNCYRCVEEAGLLPEQREVEADPWKDVYVGSISSNISPVSTTLFLEIPKNTWNYLVELSGPEPRDIQARLNLALKQYLNRNIDRLHLTPTRVRGRDAEGIEED